MRSGREDDGPSAALPVCWYEVCRPVLFKWERKAAEIAPRGRSDHASGDVQRSRIASQSLVHDIAP